MNPGLIRTIRWGVIAACVIAYPVLAHVSTATAAVTTAPWLGVGVSLAPALAILLWLTWNSSSQPAMLKPAMVLLCVAVGAALWGFWGALERNFSWLYFIQHVATNLMLAAVFGTTLGRGRQALCTRFAEAVHRSSLAPEVVRYTRQLTLAWMLFFIATSLVSALLFFFASIEIWSIFANLLSMPLILLMFAVEYGIRLYKLPHLEKHSILEGMMAFWKTPPAGR